MLSHSGTDLFLRAQCHSQPPCLQAWYLTVLVCISDLPSSQVSTRSRKHLQYPGCSALSLFQLLRHAIDVPHCHGGWVFLGLECIEDNIGLIKFLFSLYVAFAGLELTVLTKLVLSSQRCVSLCLLRARIKGVLHHDQHAVGLLIQDVYPGV